MTRKYLPTLAELLDRLSIVLLKAIFIGENREAYLEEIKLIESDLDSEFKKFTRCLSAYELRMVMMLMLSNREIWLNESDVRAGIYEKAYTDKDMAVRLAKTHSINGVRNTAKNRLSMTFGERKDLKVDCLAADLAPGLKDWDVFGD